MQYLNFKISFFFPSATEKINYYFSYVIFNCQYHSRNNNPVDRNFTEKKGTTLLHSENHENMINKGNKMVFYSIHLTVFLRDQ
jgi:hypothetical protein